MANLENIERIKLWVEALESGEFRQAAGALRKIGGGDGLLEGSGMCCLGVACEVYRRHSPPASGVEWVSQDNGVATFLGAQSMLPEAVREWYGMNDGDHSRESTHPDLKVFNPRLMDDEAEDDEAEDDTARDVTELATELNDGHEYNFKHIARCVRRTFGIIEGGEHITEPDSMES